MIRVGHSCEIYKKKKIEKLVLKFKREVKLREILLGVIFPAIIIYEIMKKKKID